MNQTQTQTEEFPLKNLQKALRGTWNEHRQKVGKPVVRIASFNLLIVSSGETDPELANIVESLQTSHPSRLIWTKLKPEKTWEESSAAVTLVTRCSGQQVCSEQIILRCGNEQARIPSIVLGMIHPGLPTHLLWWKAGALDSTLFSRLQDRSRVVLWQPEARPSNWALEFLDRTWSDPYQREHAVYPLAWFRILAMRKRIAKAFDRGPVSLRCTDAGAEMSLTHRLLKSWLTSRLGKSSELDFRWTSGPASTQLIIDGEPTPLTLDDPAEAIRAALDRAERDPVFAQTLKTLLSSASK